MADPGNELRLLRARLADAEARVDRLPVRPAVRTPALAVQVYARVTLPTTAGVFYACHPVRVTGANAENAVAGVTADTSQTVYVRVIGGAPAAGDLLTAHMVNYRWEAYREGVGATGSHTLPGCPCSSLPDVLYLRRAHPAAAGNVEFIFPCALTWQALPADIGTYRVDNPGYYSDAQLSDDGSTKFRYWLFCNSGSYSLGGLVTDDSPIGFPATINFANYLTGFPGNSCSPFALDHPSGLNPAIIAEGPTIDLTP